MLVYQRVIHSYPLSIHLHELVWYIYHQLVLDRMANEFLGPLWWIWNCPNPVMGNGSSLNLLILLPQSRMLKSLGAPHGAAEVFWHSLTRKGSGMHNSGTFPSSAETICHGGLKKLRPATFGMNNVQPTYSQHGMNFGPLPSGNLT
jgi:hypothetical protein